MRQFSGYEYVLIDIANQYGLDKENWDVRLDWATSHLLDFEDHVGSADEPLLYIKAVNALRTIQSGEPTGFIMGLDATASGLQIMAALIGCKTTAKSVNLVDTGKREDVYRMVAKKMNKMKKVHVTRKKVKKPVMTVFYGSKAKPKEIFGEGTRQLQAFYDVLDDKLPGAMDLMQDMQRCWNPEALEHSWTLPDGHVVHAKVMEPIDKKIEIDEFDHATFTHRAQVNIASDYGLSLAANIVHSVDGWVVREMLRRCNGAGFQMAAIHDSFWASPNHINEVRQFYVDILVEIANSNMMGSIINEINGGKKKKYQKFSKKLGKLIAKSEYALS